MSTSWQAVHQRALALSFRGGLEATQAAHEALRLATDEEGDDSSAAFVCSRTLASAYLASGDIPRALRFSMAAVRIGERTSAPPSALAEEISFIAYAHGVRGEAAEARSASERALKLIEGAPADASAAKVLGNLAAAAGNLREHARSRELCARIEAILEPLSNGDSDAALEARVDLGRTCVNHAKSARQLAALDEARGALQRALASLEGQRSSGLTPNAGDVEGLAEEWELLSAEGGAPLDEATRARISALRG